MEKSNLQQLHNLAMNCNTSAELNEYLIHSDIKTKLACYPYTVLSLYYFEASQNDTNNDLKNRLTITYNDSSDYFNPLTDNNNN